MEKQPALLVATDIYKNYGNISVLKGVSLEVNKAEMVSIVGASGAGKSTLLYIVSSLEKADKGQILFQNQDISALSNKQLAHYRNNQIGFVFQFHQLLPEFTAIENVCIPGYIKKTNQVDLLKRANELLCYLNLEEKINNKPNELSGGEQQRVAVARALINNPQIIFADEPSGNLDTTSAENLYKLFFDIRDKYNTTFIIVTHNQKLADLADRKIEIIDGDIN